MNGFPGLTTRIFFFLTLTLCCSLIVTAQSSTATLSGTVEDETGGLIPNATVSITDPAKGLKRTVTTNQSGSFTVPLLPPSTYTVLVEQSGFRTVQLTDIVLNVGDQKAIQIQLKVGQVGESVEVIADSSAVRTDGSVGTVIDRQFVQNIPLNGRSFQSLFELTPGVVMAPAGNPGSGDGQFSVNGQRTSSNYFTVDGVGANTAIANSTTGWAGKEASGQLPGLTASGTTASLASVDALQEFRIQTSTYAPEFGRQPGGQISLVTRSGGNDFHGTVYDYFRNEAFDANNWFNNRNQVKRPPTRQHLFGGTFSGQIYLPKFGEGGSSWYSGKNKTFFFFSYEGLRLQLPKGLEISVPTLCLRGEGSCAAGQQAAIADYQPYLRAFPKPNGPEVGSGFARFATSYADPSTYDATAIRIDHNFGKVSLFGRFSDTPSNSSSRNTVGLNFNTVSAQNNRSLTLGSTWIASKRIINDIRFNYTTSKGPVTYEPDDFGGSVPLQTFSLLGRDPVSAHMGVTILNIPITGVLSFQWGSNYDYEQHHLNIVDNLSINVGDHQLKFGLDFRRINPSLLGGGWLEFLQFQVANFTPGSVNSGRANSLTFGVSDGQPHSAAFDNLSLYAQDTWKANRRLTLTYGVRWEFVPPPHATKGPEAVVLNGLDNPLTPNNVSIAPAGTPMWKTRYFNFAPRFGASYFLVEKPGSELIVRGGGGIFYDLGLGNSANSYVGSTWPFFASVNYPNAGHPDPACRTPPTGAGQPQGIVFPFSACVLVLPAPGLQNPPNQITAIDPQIILPRTYQWNFSAEQSLGSKQIVTVSFVGAAGRDLLELEVYQGLRVSGYVYPGTTTTTLRLQRNVGYSDYQSLQVQFQRRLSRGFQSLISYTLGRSRDTDSSDGASSASVGIPDALVPRDRNYGHSSFDVRHNLTASATYQIPSFKGNSMLAAVTRNWGIDLMFRARTGFPLNATTNIQIPPLVGNQSVRANVIPEQPFWIDDPTAPGGRRLNRLAFTHLGVSGGHGDLPRNSIRGFGAKQIDLSLRREFPLFEKVRLQLRAEAYNLFNWVNFADPSGSFAAGTQPSAYGAATQTLNTRLGGLNALYQIGGPRSLQFAARISF